MLQSVNPGNNPYNNCLFRAVPSNFDLRQVLPSEIVIIGLVIGRNWRLSFLKMSVALGFLSVSEKLLGEMKDQKIY